MTASQPSPAPAPRKRAATNYDGLILRGSTWHLRFTVKGITVAESTHTSNRREAERIRDRKRAELVQQVMLAGKRPIKLHDAIDKFLKSREHMKSGRSAAVHLKYFKSAPNHFLDRITNEELDTVIANKRAEGLKESTLSISVSYMNAVIKYCDELGYTVRKKMKSLKQPTGKIRWLTKDELSKLWAALDPALGRDEVEIAFKQENFDLARLLYETGARYSEIAELNWNQVDLEKGTVYIQRLKGSISNTINMTATMKEIFTRRRKMEKGEWVFGAKHDAKHVATTWVKTAVKRAKLSEAQGTVTLHTLRHTRAVHLLQAGMNLLEVKTFLGHRDIQSTMVYVHVIETDVMAKVVKLTDEA